MSVQILLLILVSNNVSILLDHIPVHAALDTYSTVMAHHAEVKYYSYRGGSIELEKGAPVRVCIKS